MAIDRLSARVKRTADVRARSMRPLPAFSVFTLVLAFLFVACGGGGTSPSPRASAPATSPGGGATGTPAAGTPAAGSPSPAGTTAGATQGGTTASPTGGATATAAPVGTPLTAPTAPPNAPVGGQANEPCAAPPASAQNILIWNPFTGPDGPFFTAMVDQFNAAHAGKVTATVQTQPGSEYLARVAAAQQANQMPHVAAFGYDALPLLAESQAITPIDDLTQQIGLDAGDFSPQVWNAGIWKEARYGIPIDVHPLVFYYNKKLFRDAGLNPDQPPTDAQTFENAITAITAKGTPGYMMVSSGGGANFLVGLQFAMLFYQAGGEWTNADFSQATFNSEPGVRAANYLAHLVNDLKVPKVESDAEINAFKQGKNGMVLSGPWEASGYLQALGPDLGVAPVPQIFGPGDWAGSHQLTVTSAAQGDLRVAGYCFIDWFSRNSLTWAAAGQVPARNSVRQAPEFQNANQGVLGIIRQISPLFEQARFVPTIPGAGDLITGDRGGGAAAVLVINGTPAQQALDENAAFMSNILAENKADYGY